ncbi:MAG: hypothetical protein M1830_008407 [Pleopsidium flavum]|nr:MAG: hypothetical protein M1830_008407 [Pleopsidium flavum]
MPTPGGFGITLKARAEKRTVWDIWGVQGFYRVHIDMNNWDHNREGCANNLEEKFKLYCGLENVERFDFESTEFQIPERAVYTLGDPPDSAIEDTIYGYSGSSKLRIKCNRPGL